MAAVFETFKKSKNLLVCVDSDGCAMDTMNIKHIKCFGPCMVEEWGLYAWEAAILARWNEINLYTITRGINRFQGLLKALEEIHAAYTPVEGIEDLRKWVEETPELSNEALKLAISQSECAILKKVLRWSEAVNRGIGQLDETEKQPFAGVKEALSYAHRFADIAIVSSANLQAVLEEWDISGLLEHTDIVLAQDAGTKAYCIQELVKKGYERVLMIGDAAGDYEAAKANSVCFYPILVGKEAVSWQEVKEGAIPRLVSGTFEGQYQRQNIAEFMENLKIEYTGRNEHG